jgi:hypothetical protein
MTPQYILRKSLCREPHCGNHNATREQQIRAAALSEIENMDFAKGYAERGYTDPVKGVLFGNWNHFPKGVDSLLEGYGYAVEWSDEWSTCGNCYRAVRTQPDGWDWRPYFTLGDGEITCTDCLRDAGQPLPGEEMEN